MSSRLELIDKALRELEVRREELLRERECLLAVDHSTDLSVPFSPGENGSVKIRL